MRRPSATPSRTSARARPWVRGEDRRILDPHPGQVVDVEEAAVPARAAVEVEDPAPELRVAPERVVVDSRPCGWGRRRGPGRGRPRPAPAGRPRRRAPGRRGSGRSRRSRGSSRPAPARPARGRGGSRPGRAGRAPAPGPPPGRDPGRAAGGRSPASRSRRHPRAAPLQRGSVTPRPSGTAGAVARTRAVRVVATRAGRGERLRQAPGRRGAPAACVRPRRRPAPRPRPGRGGAAGPAGPARACASRGRGPSWTGPSARRSPGSWGSGTSPPSARRRRTPGAGPRATAAASAGSSWLGEVLERRGLAVLLAHEEQRHERREEHGRGGQLQAVDRPAPRAARRAARLPTWSWFWVQTTNASAGQAVGRGAVAAAADRRVAARRRRTPSQAPWPGRPSRPKSA